MSRKVLIMKTFFPGLLAVFLAVFGFLTLFLSSSVIFDLFGIRAKEGNYVLFIVIANFFSSLLYLFSAYGFLQKKEWTVKPLILSLLFLFVAFIGLLIHINMGGLYELKTVGAMVFRILLTLAFTLFAYFLIHKRRVI